MASRVAVAAGAVAAAAVVNAPSAGATLVYSTGGFSSATNPGAQWVWSARDNGTAPRRLARGAAPSVSQNGRLVAYWSLAGTDIRLSVVPAAGGMSRVILHHWSDPATLGWSPDSRSIAAATGTVGARRLVIVDVRSGKVLRTVACATPKDSDVLSLPYTYTGGKGYDVLVHHAADPKWNAAKAPR